MGRSSPSEDLRIFCDLLLVKAIEGFESPSKIFFFFFKVRVITVSQVGHVSAEMSSRFGPSSPPHSRYSLHSLSMSDWMHTQPAGKKGDPLPSHAGERGRSRKRNRSRQAPLPLGAPRTNLTKPVTTEAYLVLYRPIERLFRPSREIPRVSSGKKWRSLLKTTHFHWKLCEKACQNRRKPK